MFQLLRRDGPATERFYSSAYSRYRPAADASEKEREHRRARGLRIVEMLRPHIRTSEPRILEVGCATGENLVAACAAFGGFGVGVEPGGEAGAHAQQLIGERGRILLGDWLEADVGGDFDVVILSHVLEHLRNPERALKKIGAALAPGGVVYVEVPNLMRPEPHKRLRTWLEEAHLFSLSARGLRDVLTQNRFIVDTLVEDDVLRAIARPGVAPPMKTVSELLASLATIARHEARYWPRYVVWRLEWARGRREPWAG